MKTFGAIKYSESHKCWVILCEPHVALRAKRVFGRIHKAKQAALTLSDTPENARDLEWFLERYPMTVQRGRYLAERAQIYRDKTALVDELLSRRRKPPAFDLALPARDYQTTAAAILLARGSLLLADDVGLGKTASAIATFCDPRTLPALVVTLTHLPKQWEAEIARFAPKLRVHILKKGTPYDIAGAMKKGRGAQLGLPNAMPDVILSNYHKLSGWAGTLAPLLSSVVFDEVQELRHQDSAKYLAAEHIAAACAFRMGLSATPIYNMGAEIYSVLNILEPQALGNRDEFLREWCSGAESITEPKSFGLYVRENGLMLRRTREDVGRELPELTKVPHFIGVDAEALDKVSASCAELAKIILSQAAEAEKGAKFRASEELSNILRQATGIAKAAYVADFVRLLVEQGEKVVLFGWHHAVYAIWRDKLEDLKPVSFTGRESVVEKEAAKQAFLTGDAKVLIMSLRSGAGLDGLQGHCRTVVFGELDWSPGALEQCIGRVHRDGQTGKVVVYYLISESGADPAMCDVLQLKREQVEGIRNPKGELVERLSVDPEKVKRLAESWLAQRAKKTVAA